MAGQLANGVSSFSQPRKKEALLFFAFPSTRPRTRNIATRTDCDTLSFLFYIYYFIIFIFLCPSFTPIPLFATNSFLSTRKAHLWRQGNVGVREDHNTGGSFAAKSFYRFLFSPVSLAYQLMYLCYWRQSVISAVLFSVSLFVLFLCQRCESQ